MKINLTSIKTFIAIALFLTLWPFNSLALNYEERKVTLLRSGKPVAEITAEVADTGIKRAKGLMFRQKLDRDKGMLFIFENNTKNPFWMKNVYIPLDIIFINSSQNIISFQENSEPFSTKPIYPSGTYRFVLEVNAGLISDKDIKVGDKVIF